jgi:uncharacterized membrane protein
MNVLTEVWDSNIGVCTMKRKLCRFAIVRNDARDIRIVNKYVDEYPLSGTWAACYISCCVGGAGYCGG